MCRGEGEKQRGKERERECGADSALSVESNMGLDPTAVRS